MKGANYKVAGGTYAMPSAPEGGTGDLPIPSEAASVRSAEAIPVQTRYWRSSGEVHKLADEISSMEQRYTWLQQRNNVLTQKMMSVQKSFISQSLVGGAKVMKRRHFTAWRDIMAELLLERQLEEQTRSLDECQQVASGLGSALSEEQSLRQSHVDNHESVKEELMRVLARNDSIRHNIDKQQAKLDSLLARLQKAEACIARSKEYAVVLIEEGNSYEKKKHDIEKLQMDQREVTRAERKQYTMEESSRLREEAQSVVQKAHSLLPANSSIRNTSPSRSPQPGNRSSSRSPQPGNRMEQMTSPMYAPPRISTAPSAPAPMPMISRGMDVPPAWADAPAPTMKSKDRFSSWQSEDNFAPTSKQEAIFDAIDVNGDGVIDRKEFETYEASLKGERCVCGNVFMPDSIFCRKCGLKRPDPSSPARSRAQTYSSQVLAQATAPAPCMQVMPPTSEPSMAMPPTTIQSGVGSPMVPTPVGSASPVVGAGASFMMPRTPTLASRQPMQSMPPAQVVVGGAPIGYQQPAQPPYTVTTLLARQ